MHTLKQSELSRLASLTIGIMLLKTRYQLSYLLEIVAQTNLLDSIEECSEAKSNNCYICYRYCIGLREWRFVRAPVLHAHGCVCSTGAPSFGSGGVSVAIRTIHDESKKPRFRFLAIRYILDYRNLTICCWKMSL